MNRGTSWLGLSIAAISAVGTTSCSTHQSEDPVVQYSLNNNTPLVFPCLEVPENYGPIIICRALGLDGLRMSELPEGADWSVRAVIIPSFTPETVCTLVGNDSEGTLTLTSPQTNIWYHCADPDDGDDEVENEEEPEPPPRLWQVTAKLSGARWADLRAKLDPLDLLQQPTIPRKGFDGVGVHAFVRTAQAVNYFEQDASSRRHSPSEAPNEDDPVVGHKLTAAIYRVAHGLFHDEVSKKLLDELNWSLGVRPPVRIQLDPVYTIRIYGFVEKHICAEFASVLDKTPRDQSVLVDLSEGDVLYECDEPIQRLATRLQGIAWLVRDEMQLWMAEIGVPDWLVFTDRDAAVAFLKAAGTDD